MVISKLVAKVIGDKRRWKQYRARAQRLPEPYRAAVAAVERYLMHVGPADGDSAATMFEDLVDLFEQSAADGTPLRDVLGEDPVEFTETFLRNYSGGGWLGRERTRLTRAIDRAAEGGPAEGGGLR